MTGRKGRVVRRPDGSVRYESRAEQGYTIDQINLKEKDRFMNGEKVDLRKEISYYSFLIPLVYPVKPYFTPFSL